VKMTNLLAFKKMEQIHPHSHKVNKFTHYSSSFYPPQRVFLLMREPRTSQSDSQRPTLQVYMPHFITNNFETSKRLEYALQQRTLHVAAGLDPVQMARVHTRMFSNTDINSHNGQLDGAIYCVFVTIFHWNMTSRPAEAVGLCESYCNKHRYFSRFFLSTW